MSEKDTGLSRRNFLHMVGAAGGAAAVHETLVALGLMNHPKAWAGPPLCKPGTGQGRSVLILGAGLGGLVLADYLRQCDYRVVILEAQGRLGGRSHTARRGDTVIEEGGTQTCRFTPPKPPENELYINLGPGRIPYHHRRVMNLCRELGVDLEVYVHTSDANLHRMNRMGPYPRRRIEYDTRGYISELLSKAINQGALAEELTETDRDKLKSLLQKFGDLNKDYKYEGSLRTGCRAEPNVRVSCQTLEPLGLDVLLDSRFWDPCAVGRPAHPCDQTAYRHGFYQVDEYLWQTTSFQPIGGMDQIIKSLRERLRAAGVEIVTGAAARRIDYIKDREQIAVTTSAGVRTADYCVSNIPFTVYGDITTPHFDRDFRGAIDRRTFSNACKVGWQANRRFWELDHQIYGGISWTEHDMTQMWYPSNDYYAEKGALTGTYNYGATAHDFGGLSFRDRLQSAFAGGQQLHGGAFRNAVPIELGISIAWQKVLHQKGCSAVWILPDDDDATQRQKTEDYQRLLYPDLDGRFFVLGDQISTLPGWQEGAVMSAEHVLEQIMRGETFSAEALRKEIVEAPRSLDVMG